MVTLSLIVLAFLAVGSLVLVIALRTAPEGMEDATGFHQLPEPTKARASAEQKPCFPPAVATR
jgi:hypothetical protein